MNKEPALNAAAIAMPRPGLVHTPTDAVLASITCLVSALVGVDHINHPLPPEFGWLDDWEDFIKEGDEELAENLAKILSQSESGELPDPLLLGFKHAAFAGVFHKAGRESEAWIEAAYAALCIGIVVGSRVVFPDRISTVMTTLSEKGVEARHARMRALRSHAVALYRASTWASANAAAHALKSEVLAHAKKSGAALSEQNAQRTLAEWFRAADRSSSCPSAGQPDTSIRQGGTAAG